jgi:hypothetical protein
MLYLISLIIGGIIGSLFTLTFLKPKLKNYQGGWLKISEFPISEDAHDYIVSDGKEVYQQYSPDFNSKGQAIFSYRKKIVTHWMPYPEPPKE